MTRTELMIALAVIAERSDPEDRRTIFEAIRRIRHPQTEGGLTIPVGTVTGAPSFFEPGTASAACPQCDWKMTQKEDRLLDAIVAVNLARVRHLAEAHLETESLTP